MDEFERALVRWAARHELGVRRIAFEGLSVLRQATEVHQARVVVAQHGAALANSVWAFANETLIVELGPVKQRVFQ